MSTGYDMHEKLKNIPMEHRGIALGLIGFFVMLAGLIASFTYFPKYGFFVVASGIGLGFFGVLLHFVLNWKRIFKGYS